MARICLITPGQLSTNPRIVKEADALTEAGHQVSVICTRMATWATETDREFADRDWTVSACIPLGPFERPMKRIYRGVRRRIARKVFESVVQTQSIAEMAWHDVTRELIRAARRVPADFYIAHYPAALPAAAKAARDRNVGYAYDAEDFHLGDPPASAAFESIRALTRRIEGAYLAGASYVTAASPGIADAYASAYGINRPTVVLNVFPRSNAPASPTESGCALPGPSIYWFSQTIGKDRGLECAVRAISIAQCRPHLYLRGRPAAGFEARLASVAAEYGVPGHVHLLEPTTPSSLERLAAQYDLGLAAETGGTENHRVALANKIFTYALAGIPILLSDIPAHRDFAQRLGSSARLFAVEDPYGLAQSMDAFLSEPTQQRADRRRSLWELAQATLNWDTEKAILLARVDEALTNPSAVGSSLSLRQ